MQRTLFRTVLLLLCAMPIGLVAPARGAVTLRGELLDPSCILNGAPVACLTFSDSVVLDVRLGPGESATVTAQLRYDYTDDGLPLQPPGSVQMDANGFSFLPVDHEVGAIYAISNQCAGSRACPSIPGVSVFGTEAFPPLLLGLNATPDHLTGVVPLVSTVGVAPDGLFSAGPVSVRWTAAVFASPVPEAGTAAQLAAGAVAMLLLVRGAGGRRSSGPLRR